MSRSRFAPTPSGYLHLGNAINFTLIALLVRSSSGEVYLRIDDLDSERARNEFLDDIFEQLEWLGLQWDHGPKDREDFLGHYSQNLKMGHFLKLLDSIQEDLYACSCSRSEIASRSPEGVYPGTCRLKNLDKSDPRFTLRARVEDSTVNIPSLWGPDRSVVLKEAIGDFVVRRKDLRPSYQWVSVVEDQESSYDLVVRGEDLLGSTAAQLWLAKKAGFSNLLNAKFLHHPLLTNREGGKLSKSDKSLSLREMREQGVTRREIYHQMAKFFDFPRPLPENFEQLLEAFRNVSPALHFSRAFGHRSVPSGNELHSKS